MWPLLGPISRESDAGLISENITKTLSILQIITFYILDFLRNLLLGIFLSISKLLYYIEEIFFKSVKAKL
jgi:hypothetical protein